MFRNIRARRFIVLNPSSLAGLNVKMTWRLLYIFVGTCFIHSFFYIVSYSEENLPRVHVTRHSLLNLILILIQTEYVL